jgi:hypothetical protein
LNKTEIIIPAVLGFVSLISPFLGMIFVIAYCGKIWHLEFKRQIIILATYLLLIIMIAVYDNSLAVWLNASDAIVGIGLGAVLFVFILRQYYDLNKSLAILVIYQIGYCFFRNWLFAPTLTELSQQMTPLYETYLRKVPALEINKDTIAWIQNFMLSYQSAIWGSIQLTGSFLGFLLFNKLSFLKLQVRLIRFPFVFVFLLIVSLAMAVYQNSRLFGINLLICMSIIYLIQGIAVLSFAWGDYFAKARLLRTFLIVAVIFNYPVIILIAFIGVLDVWFDFRKLNIMEEKHESNIN